MNNKKPNSFREEKQKDFNENNNNNEKKSKENTFGAKIDNNSRLIENRVDCSEINIRMQYIEERDAVLIIFIY